MFVPQHDARYAMIPENGKPSRTVNSKIRWIKGDGHGVGSSTECLSKRDVADEM
jgi:hypothetical protein